MIHLPTYEKGGPVKRGRQADLVFQCADRAHMVTHQAMTGSEAQKIVPLEEARRLWNENRRVKMERQPCGPFVFVIMNATGYVRVTLWGVS